MTKQTGEQWREAVNRVTREARGHTTAPDSAPALNKGMNQAMRAMLHESYGLQPKRGDQRDTGE